MRWQHQKPGLRRLVDEAERMCGENLRMQRDLEVQARSLKARFTGKLVLDTRCFVVEVSRSS